jgi:hypothetical protein
MTPRADLQGVQTQYDESMGCWTAIREDGWLTGTGTDERSATNDLLRQEDEACAAAMAWGEVA